MMQTILLGHGSGGQMTHELVKNLFFRLFDNKILSKATDSALLAQPAGEIAFTTDAFVVDPIFFPGGDIGKLSVCGTVNDLAAAGADPLYISVSFIIEEGFPMADLEKIAASIASEAKEANVAIVAGDTKVVERGKCDKIFISSSGIGLVPANSGHISAGKRIVPGDKIIINGSIGDHGMAVMAARESLTFKGRLLSDCASLNRMTRNVLNSSGGVKFMRDATRGGLGTVLCELSEKKEFGINIVEKLIPVKEEVRGICEILGFDPLYVANEGKMVMVVDAGEADRILSILSSDPLGSQSAIIGEIVSDHAGKTTLETEIGGRRIIDMLAGEQLPRIC